ncbi:MAG TPA: hypothetical protein VEZ90_08445 [Blastocatellia bacterium]|nr:hypothetical protein [Blastocatellia bacterium]
MSTKRSKGGYTAFFIVALFSEIGAALLDWAQLGPRDCYRLVYEGRFLIYALSRLVPFLVLWLSLTVIWLVVSRAVGRSDSDSKSK